MRTLLLILLISLSLQISSDKPIQLPEQRYTVDLGYPIREGEKAPVEPPKKVVSYSDRWDEHDCLSHTMYWEAKGKAEGKLGMVMVGLVILNRVNSNKRYFADKICDVVKQPRVFSYFWDGKSDVPKERDRFLLAQSIASELLIGKYDGLISKNVLFYKRCDTFSEFFSKLKFYKRHVSHCYYLGE